MSALRKLVKSVLTRFFTALCLRRVRRRGRGVKANFYCKFTRNVEIGDYCHFNGCKCYGDGRIVFGSHFHSGKNIRILTTFHNYENDNRLPYDDTVVTKDVIIEDNVWLGQDVLILGGVTIGEGAVIQAGSVVCRNVPRLAVAGGHPATAFKYRDQERYDRLRAEQLERDGQARASEKSEGES